jgi:hypothetical protein
VSSLQDHTFYFFVICKRKRSGDFTAFQKTKQFRSKKSFPEINQANKELRFPVRMRGKRLFILGPKPHHYLMNPGGQGRGYGGNEQMDAKKASSMRGL